MFNVNDRIMVITNTVDTDSDANEFIGHTGTIVGERKFSDFRWQIKFDDEIIQIKAVESGYAWKNDELILLDSDNKNYVR